MSEGARLRPRDGVRLRVAVVGAGSWGTAMARHLDAVGARVRLLGRRADQAEEIRATGRNPTHLRDVRLPASLEAGVYTHGTLEDVDLVVMAVPSKGYAAVAASLTERLPHGVGVLSLTKGVEPGSLRRFSEVLADLWVALEPRIAILAGPNHAEEVSLDQPTATVIASPFELRSDRLTSRPRLLHEVVLLGSLPFSSRPMFPRCAYTTNETANRENTTYGNGLPIAAASGIRVKLATSDANETSDVLNRMMANTPTTSAAVTGISANSTPAPVATPLPPLPRRNMDQLCPAITAKATTTVAVGPTRRLAVSAATNPLATSATKTARPSPVPRTRKALVVPALPLPCSLRSSPLNSRPRNTLGEIDPTR